MAKPNKTDRLSGERPASLPRAGSDEANQGSGADRPVERAMSPRAGEDLPSLSAQPQDRPTIADVPIVSASGDGNGAAAALPPRPVTVPHGAPSSSSMANAVPHIEGFEVLGPLGKGAMGTVWRAIQHSTRREVALKLLNADRFGSGSAHARFEREVELSARLEHPNIARVYEGGVVQGMCYYAMELVDGVHLDQYVHDHNLPEREILKLLDTVCRAVQHAHQRAVIHRDLKPSNIVVTRDGQPHVLDFGLAKTVAEGEAALTMSVTGEVAGTPAYMSPEQAAGRVHQVDTRSDVYSLGVVLYHLLTGQFPHDLTRPRHEVLRQIAEEDVRRPRTVKKGISHELEAILLKALAHDPDSRYASASDLARDIHSYLADEPIMAERLRTSYLLSKLVRRHNLPIAVGIMILLVLGGMACLFGHLPQVNTFSLHNLAGVMATGSLAMVFYLLYLASGRQLVDVLYATLLLCAAAACFFYFRADNVIPIGSSSWRPGAGQETLFWYQWQATIGTFAMPIQVHFLFRYCRARHWLSRNVYLLYVGSLASLVLVWSGWMLGERTAPIASTADWLHTVPWAPVSLPPVYAYLGLWLAVQLYSQVFLILQDRKAIGEDSRQQMRLIRWGFLVFAVSTIIDLGTGTVGYAGPGLLPLAAIVMGIILTSAMVRARLTPPHA